MRTRTFTEDEAWERSGHFAAPNCRRCHGTGTYWRYMHEDQSALHLCICIRNKAGFVPGTVYSK